MRQTVAVLRLVDGLYELVDYTSDQRLESALLPGLDLTVAEILRAGNST